MIFLFYIGNNQRRMQIDQTRSQVLHTRKQVIAIFDELKNRINIAYQAETEQSFQQLLTIVKVIYHLRQMPKFLREINQIGSIPVSIFLENLLIKTTMVKIPTIAAFRNWVINLILIFKEAIPSINIDKVKEVRTKQYSPIEENSYDEVITFVVEDLQKAVKKRDIGIVAVLLHFLRVILLNGQLQRVSQLDKQDNKWKQLVEGIVEGTKILDNLKRQEMAVCLCYYLCLKEKQLCESAVKQGIVDYLVDTLNRKFIGMAFGRKIIQFLKYLLLNLDRIFIEQIDIDLFEKALALFSSRFDRQQIITSIHDLATIIEQKVTLIDYQQKLQTLATISQQCQGQNIVPQHFIESLHVINLYIHNDRMGNMIVKYYPSLLAKLLTNYQDPQVVKMLAEFMGCNFKKGKLKEEAALQVIGKVDEVISNSAVREELLEGRKHLLIAFVKILKLLLENREYQEKVSWAINTKELEQKLWDYSDCTNYMYERELIELRRMLGKSDNEFESKEIDVLKRLEEDIINKSKFSLNKLTWELYQQVKFLENLLGENGTKGNYRPATQIPTVVANYIQISTHKANFTLLENIQNEDSQQLRKEFNLVCCRLLTKLARGKKEIGNKVKQKMMALTTSLDEIEDIYDMVNNFFQTEEEIQEEHERRQSTLRASQAMQEQLHKHIELNDNIKGIMFEYFRNNGMLDVAILKVNSPDELAIVIEELNKYENEQDILKYLKVVLELSKKDSICGQLYSGLSQKIHAIYQALSGRQAPGDEEVIIVIENITLKFLRFHIKCLFNDNYDADSVNYYMQYVGEIDEHFEFGFTQKRIELLELIIEYLECNMIESQNDYEKLIKKEDRSEIIRDFIDRNKAEAIGLSYGKLLSLNFDDEVHQAFWMQHREHIIRGLQQNTQNTPYIKFLQVYITECEAFIFKQHQLQNLLQTAIDLFLKECASSEQIGGHLPGGVLKLRKFKYFSLLLNSFVDREDLKANKNVLFIEEEVMVKALTLLLESSQQIPAESFRKFYTEQIIVTLLKTLTKLYKNNFINKQIKGEELVSYFDKLMEISSEDSINCVCALMRAFLLKKFVSMAQCSALHSCYQFIDSLPPEGQEHIQACMRIEQLLSEDKSLDEQNEKFFNSVVEEESEALDEDFEKFAEKMLKQQEARKNEDELPQTPSKPQIVEPEKIEPAVITIAEKIVPSSETKRMSQFLGQLESKWTEVQLLEALKKILKDPSSLSIKELSARLLSIDTIDYYHLLTELFFLSEDLYAKDESAIELTLQQVQQAIIDHIPGSVCPIDSTYFEILNKNMVGASICLRKKGGLKATESLSRGVLEAIDPQIMAQYMYLLGQNVCSSNELKYLNGIKIYDKVNRNIETLIKQDEHLVKVCQFITATAENPTLRSNYNVSGTLSMILTEGTLKDPTKLAVIRALNKLTADSSKHKQIAEKTNIIPFLAEVLQDEDIDQTLLVPSANLLANVISYSEALISKVYEGLNLEEFMVKVLKGEVEKRKYSTLFLSCLQVLQFLSLNGKSALKIVKAKVGFLLLPISKYSIGSGQNQVVGAEIALLANLMNEKNNKLDDIVENLMNEGLLLFMVQSSPVVPKLKKSQVFLEIMIKILSIPGMPAKCMQRQELLKILLEILRCNQTEIVIIQKWTKILYQMFDSLKFQHGGDIMRSNLFYLAANCLKPNYFLTESTMNMTIKLMKELNNIEDPEQLLIRHGFASFMIEVLRMKNLNTQDYISLLTLLKKLQEKSSMFPPHLSTRLFEIVIKNLEYHWKDHLAVKSILLLKKIKKNVEITTQFSHAIFEFFNKFLVLSGKSNSNYEYYSISRQVICLVSYFINFNEQVKLLFRNQVIINLLKNWLKTYKSIAEDQSAQTYRLWLYSIFSNQTYTYDVCNINNSKLSEIEGRFQKGWKCNLFRLDGSYKTAMFRYDRKNDQLVAFKYPGGDIKSKYSLPLKNILFVYRYQSQDDFLLEDSRFTRTFNPFQHDVNYQHCVTIFCLIEQRFDVREISLEMSNSQETEDVYVGLKIMLNKIIERQKEEEVKYWIARSSKEIPIGNP